MKPKREYRRPVMTVVELKKQCCILAGSGEGLNASRSSYDHGRTDGGNGTDEEVWQ